jgi:hypothetical protein
MMDTRVPPEAMASSRNRIGQAVALSEALRPGYCHRWHACPEMAGSEDIAAHAARVARIILWAWPQASAAALAWAITHDDGEMGLGDVSGVAKRRHPSLAMMLDTVEAQNRTALGIEDPVLSPPTELLCDLADKLAGLYHVRQMRPDLLYDGPWQADLTYMRKRFTAFLARASDPVQRLRAAFEADFQQWLEDGSEFAHG